MNKRFNIPFIDICLNTLLVFIVLFVLTPKKKQEEAAIKTEGEYLITFHWDEKSNDDVDAYVRDPGAHLVFFRRREDGLMHLERDDLGRRNDVIQSKGQEIQVEKNEERVVLRGLVPGEYVVNAHMYRKEDQTPTAVKVTLIKIRGADQEITNREVTLEATGDEKTAFRFTLDAKGDVSNINHLPRSLTKIETNEEDGENDR